jgi:hypothetical protein
MRVPPPSEESKHVEDLRRTLRRQIDEAIDVAKATNKWPAVALVPADCHGRDVKGPVLQEYRAQRWRVFHTIGTDNIQINLPTR